MVFYRKYRPQTINELDSAQVREALGSVLVSNTPHAFLFTGPKGLGKTSTARIVAKVVNCTGRDKKDTIEPCNICEQCVSITNGTNMDILEIDAASNRGIDEIRDLKEKIRLSPLKAAKKVYIIDEVHMLTTEAFNALLKTLEEPPDHALFVLCTTEAHKVPETIISRCFHIAFQRATPQELIRSFKRIVEGENIAIDDEALGAIAQLSDGGFRDGAKVLEELSVVSKNQNITKELVEEKYHVASIAHQIQQLLTALAKRDRQAGLAVIATITGQGVDIRYFVQQLVEVLHEVLLEKVGVSKVSSVKAVELGIDEIKVLFELLSKASSDMRYAVLPQLPLELVVIEWTQKEVRNESKKPSQIAKPEEDQGVSVSSLRKHVGEMHKQKALAGEVDEKPTIKPETPPPGVSLLQYNHNGEHTKEWIDELWKNIIFRMKDHNHTLAGVLRGCHLKSYDRKEVVIETAYKFHKERLDMPKTKDILDSICSDLTGNPVTVRVELKTR